MEGANSDMLLYVGDHMFWPPVSSHVRAQKRRNLARPSSPGAPAFVCWQTCRKTPGLVDQHQMFFGGAVYKACLVSSKYPPWLMRFCVYGVLEHFIAQLSNQRIGNHPDIHISCPTVKIVFFPNLHSGSFQTPFECCLRVERPSISLLVRNVYGCGCGRSLGSHTQHTCCHFNYPSAYLNSTSFISRPSQRIAWQVLLFF